jgi:hypothetical protein
MRRYVNEAGKLRHRLAAIACVAGAALVAAALLVPAGDDDPRGPSIAPLAQAAERTAKYPGARMTFRGELEVPGSGTLISMRGKGSFNGETGLSRTKVTAAELPEGGPTAAEESFELEQVAEQSAGTFVMYTRSEAFGELPEGAEWMMVDMSESTAQTQSLDPRDQLKILRSSKDFEELGTEEVRGVETTHYRATVDQEAEVERLREEGEDEAADALELVIAANDGETTSEVEVWVDEKSTIHRMIMEIPFSIGAIPSESTMRITIDLFDFGIKPDITVPDEDVVFDATELAQEQLEQEAE